MGLLGIWNWMKGNKKCHKCGSYSTRVISENVAYEKQEWKTDFAFPRNAHGVRPQSLFTERAVQVFCACDNCEHRFILTDFRTHRS